MQSKQKILDLRRIYKTRNMSGYHIFYGNKCLKLFDNFYQLKHTQTAHKIVNYM